MHLLTQMLVGWALMQLIIMDMSTGILYLVPHPIFITCYAQMLQGNVMCQLHPKIIDVQELIILGLPIRVLNIWDGNIAVFI